MDYRAMFDRDYIGSWDLNGKDVVVVIASVKAGELTSGGNKKSKKPIIFFKGKDKGFACNKTNGKVIASLYGPDTRKWIGQPIIIYPTQTQFGSETMDCIRVRNRRPEARSQTKEDVTAPPEAKSETLSDGGPMSAPEASAGP